MTELIQAHGLHMFQQSREQEEKFTKVTQKSSTATYTYNRSNNFSHWFLKKLAISWINPNIWLICILSTWWEESNVTSLNFKCRQILIQWMGPVLYLFHSFYQCGKSVHGYYIFFLYTNCYRNKRKILTSVSKFLAIIAASKELLEAKTTMSLVTEEKRNLTLNTNTTI